MTSRLSAKRHVLRTEFMLFLLKKNGSFKSIFLKQILD
jgi:hypothetical protein